MLHTINVTHKNWAHRNIKMKLACKVRKTGHMMKKYLSLSTDKYSMVDAFRWVFISALFLDKKEMERINCHKALLI